MGKSLLSLRAQHKSFWLLRRHGCILGVHVSFLSKEEEDPTKEKCRMTFEDKSCRGLDERFCVFGVWSQQSIYKIERSRAQCICNVASPGVVKQKVDSGVISEEWWRNERRHSLPVERRVA